LWQQIIDDAPGRRGQWRDDLAPAQDLRLGAPSQSGVTFESVGRRYHEVAIAESVVVAS
jgi:hypothetical protein